MSIAAASEKTAVTLTIEGRAGAVPAGTSVLVLAALPRWRSLATRAYVMETGRITLAGPAAELARNEHGKRAYLGG